MPQTRAECSPNMDDNTVLASYYSLVIHLCSSLVLCTSCRTPHGDHNAMRFRNHIVIESSHNGDCPFARASNTLAYRQKRIHRRYPSGLAGRTNHGFFRPSWAVVMLL
ncbi:hypothetical protein VTK26DRAFT_7499 [Humicola hyalothermophila]